MINKRFGKEFAAAKFKLFTVLILFSASFLVRASWDIYIKFDPNMHFDNEIVWGIVLFSLYFTTEWLPLSVVYFMHFFDFYRNLQSEKSQ